MTTETTRKEVIGNCELYLGDCREILPTIGKVDAIVTDPPFGMNYQSARRSDKHEKISADDDDELLKWVCLLPALHSKYIFCRWDNLKYIPTPKSVITWVKNNWTSGDLDHAHARQTELISFYTGENHFFPKYRPPDVVECPKVNSDDHPTEKPLQLMKTIVEWTNGIVFDPFMGSGATGAACAKLGRKFIGVEINQKFFDLACRRIEDAYKQADMFYSMEKVK